MDQLEHSPSRRSAEEKRLIEILGKTKADQTTTRIRVCLVPKHWTQEFRTIIPGAATQDALTAIAKLRVIPAILYPLPQVAAHIIKSEAVGLLPSYRLGFPITVLVKPCIFG